VKRNAPCTNTSLNPSPLSPLLVADQDKYQNEAKVKGAVVRPSVKVLDKVGTSRFPVEAGRYRLYVAEACPWSHRTYMMWKLKGLDKGIVGLTLTGWKLENISFTPPYDDYHGWDFDESEGSESR
jgi:glutathionyl-hydroquinone reductase